MPVGGSVSFVLQFDAGNSPYGRSERRASGVEDTGVFGRRGVPGMYPDASSTDCSSRARSVDVRAGERNDVETSGHSPRDLRGSEYTMCDDRVARRALLTVAHVGCETGTTWDT